MRKLSVPLLKQSRLACGPTALRMVLHYFGKDVSSNEIIRKIGGVRKYGVTTIKLADLARKWGFNVDCYSYNKKLARGKATIRKPAKSDIIKFLKRKLPVIIAVRAFILFKKEPSDMGHFIVVTKYENGTFGYNDPSDGKHHQINEKKLMNAWYANSLDSSAHLLILEPKD